MSKDNKNGKTAHTPGPWEAILHEVEDVHDKSGMTHVFASGAETVVADCHCISGQSVEESEANARLIAAAPELLDALYALASRWDGCPHDQCPREVKDARAAIAKAKGE